MPEEGRFKLSAGDRAFSTVSLYAIMLYISHIIICIPKLPCPDNISFFDIIRHSAFTFVSIFKEMSRQNNVNPNSRLLAPPMTIVTTVSASYYSFGRYVLTHSRPLHSIQFPQNKKWVLYLVLQIQRSLASPHRHHQQPPQ